MLPEATHAPLRHYRQRLTYWWNLMKIVRGVSWRDTFWLCLSFTLSPFTSLMGLQEWRDPVLLREVDVEVLRVGMFTLRPRTDDIAHVLPFREPAVTETVLRHLGRGACFVDAGANIGFYSILASRLVGETGRVIAIEMMPDTASILREHVTRNEAANVSVVECAVADADGETVQATVPPGYHGRASIAGASSTGKSQLVRTATLNTILDEIGLVDLLKLDLEGAETLALKGASKVLSRVRAVVFEHLTEEAALEVQSILCGAGFKIERISSNESLAIRA